MKEHFDWAGRYGEVECVYPTYGQDGGNYSVIRLVGGEEILYTKKTGTVLLEACRAFGVDPEARRRQYQPLAGRQRSTPLALWPDFTLIPVRTRAGVDKGQGTQGYVVCARIKDCAPPPAGSPDEFLGAVVFQDGTSLPTLHRPQTLKNLWRVAREIEEDFRARQQAGPWSPAALPPGLFPGQFPEEVYLVAKYRLPQAGHREGRPGALSPTRGQA